MNNFTKFLAVGALISSTALANAADSSNMYLLLEGGYSKMANKDKIISDSVDRDNSMVGYGPVTISKKLKKASGGFIGAGVGYKFDPNFRTDFTLNFLPTTTTKTSFDNVNKSPVSYKGKLSSFAGMINAYYDINSFGDMVVPYIGAGFGLAKNNYKISNAYKSSSTVQDEVETDKSKAGAQFAWQVGAGTLVKIADNVNLKIGYRYMDFGKVKLKSDSSLKSNVRAHQFIGGVQFSL